MDIAEFKREHLKTVNEWKSMKLWYQGGRMSWHARYNDILYAVKAMKSELGKQGNFDITKAEHRIFLYRLLYDSDNGISNAGKGAIKYENYETLIKKTEVLDAIKAVIMNPTADTAQHLGTSLHCGQNHWLIANRVVAACTNEVSSTVSLEKFSLIFNWLIKEDIIEDYPAKCFYDLEEGRFLKGMTVSEWYEENAHLMSNLYKLFENEINTGDTDKTFISMYVWQKWEDEYFEEWEENKKKAKSGNRYR